MEYRFANCCLNTERYELWRDGSLVRMEPQVFDLLRYLLEHRDQVVTQDELIESVWKGRIVSDATISTRISATRTAVGDNGQKQAIIKTLPRRGFKFVADVSSGDDAADGRDTHDDRNHHHQKINFAHSKDGTHIAYSVSGQGYPLLIAGHWLTHLEQDWNSPLWRPLLDELCRHFTVIRYDQRGNGLSDWKVSDFTLARFVEDMEAVVEAAGFDRFAIYARSQGSPVSIRYARKHADRISQLVIHGGYVLGRLIRDSEEEVEKARAVITLMRYGWGQPDSPFIQAFASMFIPGGSKEQLDYIAELQKTTTSAENAVSIRTAVDQFDVSEDLPHIDLPTLIIHAQNDGVHPLQQGKELAYGIPGARLVLLDSPNHVILEQEPAFKELINELKLFIPGDQLR